METDLIKNLDKIHTTELGAGKNWYVDVDGCI